MTDWSKQTYLDQVAVGDELEAVSIPITLQRLVIEAGANRDLSLIHHDRDVAKATGAPDAYMNTFFIAGMFERLLREWMGLQGRIKKLSNLRMKIFNSVGEVVTFKGKVVEVHPDAGSVLLQLWSETEQGETVTAQATVILPSRP